MKKFKVSLTLDVHAENEKEANNEFFSNVHGGNFDNNDIKIKKMKESSSVKTYIVTYRDEISVEVQAENEDQAVYLAEQSDEWSFLLREGHKDFFEVEEE